MVLAYQHLIDENYLLSHERRGYFVNPEILDGRVEVRPADRQTQSDLNVQYSPDTVVDLLAQRNIQRPFDWQSFDYPFIYGQVDPALFPVNDWREASRLSLRVGAISKWTHDQG